MLLIRICGAQNWFRCNSSRIVVVISDGVYAFMTLVHVMRIDRRERIQSLINWNDSALPLWSVIRLPAVYTLSSIRAENVAWIFAHRPWWNWSACYGYAFPAGIDVFHFLLLSSFLETEPCGQTNDGCQCNQANCHSDRTTCWQSTLALRGR